MQKYFDIELDRLAIKKSASVLVGVSGGPDSVCMLDLLVHSRLELRIAVAHVNFSLRGVDSDSDELFVGELCKTFSIPFHSIQFDTLEYAKSRSLSVEMAARDLRYEWFNSLIKKHGYNYLAIAHNANDNAETLLLNLVRGTGLNGLCGMRECGVAGENIGSLIPECKIIRPLLNFTRKEIENYLHYRGLKYKIDRTNADSDIARNRIRNIVIPQLEIINPSLIKTFSENIKHFTQAKLFLETCLPLNASDEEKNESRTAVLDKMFLVESTDILDDNFILYNILCKYGINSRQLEDLVRSQYKPESKLFYTPEYIVAKERMKIKIYRKSVLDKIEPISIEESQIRNTCCGTPMIISAGAFKFSLMLKSCNEAPVGIIRISVDKLCFPLSVRTIRSGEKFIPYGMRGSKKINDYFADKKLDRLYKGVIPLLCDGYDSIIAVIPFEIDNRYRVDSSSMKYIDVCLLNK